VFTHAEAHTDERGKLWAALRRAVPITRMVDYGVALGDALQVHEAAADETRPAWDDTCERLALKHIRLARLAGEAGHRLTSAQAWRAASALLQCAHLAFNDDRPRKKALYRRASEAMQQHAALSDDLVASALPAGAGRVFAWVVRPRTQAMHPMQPAPSVLPLGPFHSAVVVLGGLSGWGASYLDMGRALAARGILAVLGEGPGQGLARMQEGLYLNAANLPLFSVFVDHATSLGARRVGVWGNSFGGLVAAHLAVRDTRIEAACINGAPMAPTLPDFRTAREQMQAAFGASPEAELAAHAAALALDARRHRTDAAMLVVQGGRDPLVPLGSQEEFLALSSSTMRSCCTWSDGEHTIYNHAQERNNRVADWFAEQLGTGRP
jgi:esterase/lipase